VIIYQATAMSLLWPATIGTSDILRRGLQFPNPELSDNKEYSKNIFFWLDIVLVPLDFLEVPSLLLSRTTTQLETTVIIFVLLDSEEKCEGDAREDGYV
jgi:hypothetical protein